MNQLSRFGASNVTALSSYDNRSYSPFGYFGQNSNRIVSPNHLSNTIAPIQFERLAADIQDWRDAMREMELAFFPFRTKSTRIYIDTAENVFVKGLISRMKELVLQRQPEIYQIKNGKKIVSKELSQELNCNFWFEDYRGLVIDAILWGFRLIELGDIDPYSNNLFPEMTFTRPENIRIDTWRGALLTSIPYYIDGIEVQNDEIVKLWNHYIPTNSNRGVSKCGYGLLYNISEYAIHLKHLLGWRLDFIENYGQPTRVGTTNKIGSALKKFEAFLANPSSNQYVLLNKAVGDEFRLEENSCGGTGTGWKNHGDTSTFLKKELSLMCFGHEDVMMTTAGKVGANVTSNKDGFNESGMETAVNGKQDLYSNFEIRKMNEITFPSFRKLAKHTGCKRLNFVPEGYIYGLTNDKESQEVSRRFNANMEAKGRWVLSLYNGGIRLKNVEDLNALVPEIPNGFEFHEPEKQLDENRNSKNTIKKIDPIDSK